jgi:hypothetical protein
MSQLLMRFGVRTKIFIVTVCSSKPNTRKNTDDFGKEVGSGVYYYHLLTEYSYEGNKMLLLM